MTFGEFMDKMREIYDGNERDFGTIEVKVAVGNAVRDFADAVFYPGKCALCDAAAAGVPPVSRPPSLGKVFVLEKLRFDRYEYEKSCTSAFASFKAANDAMRDDYRIELNGHKCQVGDVDWSYTDQQMPGELDDCGGLEFRDGSHIDWYIREAEVEHGEEA